MTCARWITLQLFALTLPSKILQSVRVIGMLMLYFDVLIVERILCFPPKSSVFGMRIGDSTWIRSQRGASNAGRKSGSGRANPNSPRRKNENHGAQPVARANDPICHGLCSEPHIPRQLRSRLILNVGQNMKIEKLSIEVDVFGDTDPFIQ